MRIDVVQAAPPTGAFVVIGSPPGTLASARQLLGTSNQITVTDGGAGVSATLSLPQNIHTGASPTFAGLTLFSSGAVTSQFDADGGSFTLQATGYGGGANAAGILALRSARGTLASPTASEADDVLGRISGSGYTGSAFALKGSYDIVAAETWDGSGNGVYHKWRGTPVDSTSITEWMRLDGTLKLGVIDPAASTSLLQTNKQLTARPSGTHSSITTYTTLRGAGPISDNTFSVLHSLHDDGVMNAAISDATGNGVSPIVLTTAAHTFVTGDRLQIDGVLGNTAANGIWTVTIPDNTHISLNGTTGNGAYIASGSDIATNRPVLIGVGVSMDLEVSRGLTGTNANTDDATAFAARNDSASPFKATDAYYVAHNPAFSTSEWITLFTSDAHADYGIRLNGTIVNVGLDFNSGTFGSLIRLKNAGWITGRNAAGSADLNVLRLNAANQAELGQTTIIASDASSVGLGQSTPLAQLHLTHGVSGYSEYTDLIGLVTSNGAIAKDSIDESSYAGSSTRFNGQLFELSVNPASNASRTVTAGYFNAHVPGANSTALAGYTLVGGTFRGDYRGTGSILNVLGANNIATIANTGNVTLLIGNIGTAQKTSAGTGTLATMQALAGTLTNSAATGTVTTAVGVDVNNLTNAGTITNTYGVRVGDITAGTQTNTPYSFYGSDAGAYSYFAGNVGIGTNATVPTSLFSVDEKFRVDSNGKAVEYANVNTAGWGVPAIYAAGRSTAQTAAVATVATYTVGAADGSFEVSANVLVTTATTHNFTVTCAYTDEGNTARTLTLAFTLVAGGTLVTAVANGNGAVPYMGVPQHIRCKAATAITIATTGTFTTVTYNVEGIIRQMA